MGQKYAGTNINTITGFEVGASKPIDPRMQVDTHADLDNITYTWVGMTVFVEDEGEDYQLKSTGWVKKSTQGPKGDTGAQGPKGDTGAAGAKGDTGATGTSMRMKGAWAASTAYVNNSQYVDFVTQGGNTYACKTSHTSGTSFDATNWTMVAQKGATGAAGAKGDTGAQGPKGDTGAQGPKGENGDSLKVGTSLENAKEVKLFFKVIGG